MTDFFKKFDINQIYKLWKTPGVLSPEFSKLAEQAITVYYTEGDVTESTTDIEQETDEQTPNQRKRKLSEVLNYFSDAQPQTADQIQLEELSFKISRIENDLRNGKYVNDTEWWELLPQLSLPSEITSQDIPEEFKMIGNLLLDRQEAALDPMEELMLHRQQPIDALLYELIEPLNDDPLEGTSHPESHAIPK